MAAKRTGRASTVVRDRTTHQRLSGKLPHATSSVGGTKSHQERGIGAHVVLGSRQGLPAVGWEVDQERRRQQRERRESIDMR